MSSCWQTNKHMWEAVSIVRIFTTESVCGPVKLWTAVVGIPTFRIKVQLDTNNHNHLNCRHRSYFSEHQRTLEMHLSVKVTRWTFLTSFSFLPSAVPTTFVQQMAGLICVITVCCSAGFGVGRVHPSMVLILETEQLTLPFYLYFLDVYVKQRSNYNRITAPQRRFKMLPQLDIFNLSVSVFNLYAVTVTSADQSYYSDCTDTFRVLTFPWPVLLWVKKLLDLYHWSQLSCPSSDDCGKKTLPVNT